MESFEQFADYLLHSSNHNIKDNKDVHIIIDYPQLEWGEFKQYLMTLTWQFGIPWNRGIDANKHHVIFAKDLDEAMTQTDDYDYALISYVGTVFRRGQFAGDKTIWDYFDKWKKTDVPVKGHILWHPDKQYGRLHPQTIFLDLQHWRSIDRPTFAPVECSVMVPERDPDNVHDDYTPWWLKPSKDHVMLEKKHEQALYISKVLKDGKEIHNFTPAERSTKYFTYPQRPEISPQLFNDKNATDNILYFKNNQRFTNIIRSMQKRVDPTREYDVIYAPASGNIGEFLWKNFGHKDTQLIFLDNHKPSIQFKNLVYNMGPRPKTMVDLWRRLKYIENVYPDVHIDTCDYKPEIRDGNDLAFPEKEWLWVMQNIKSVEAKNFDLIKDILHSKFNIDENKRKLIYTSNIFSYWRHFHLYDVGVLFDKLRYLTRLPNTTVIGSSPSRENILTENF